MLVYGILGPSRDLLSLIASDFSDYCMCSKSVLDFRLLIFRLILDLCIWFMLMAHDAVDMIFTFQGKYLWPPLFLTRQFLTGMLFPRVLREFNLFLFSRQISWSLTCCLCTENYRDTSPLLLPNQLLVLTIYIDFIIFYLRDPDGKKSEDFFRLSLAKLFLLFIHCYAWNTIIIINSLRLSFC